MSAYIVTFVTLCYLKVDFDPITDLYAKISDMDEPNDANCRIHQLYAVQLLEFLAHQLLLHKSRIPALCAGLPH